MQPITLSPPQSQTFIDKEQVLQALTFEAVLGHYNINILPREQVRCPFHGEDRKPSASIRNNYFYCFTCQKSLDALGLIQNMENCSFTEALKIAAELAGIRPTASRIDLSNTLKRRKHDQSEAERIRHASEAKYRIFATIARLYRIFTPHFMGKLDFLLNEWLYAVPLWVDVRPLIFGFDSFCEVQRTIIRLYDENSARGGKNE